MALNQNVLLENAILTQLGQLRPANTTAASIYTLPAKKIVWATSLIICNTTASATTWSAYFHQSGTTYNQTTALIYGSAINGNQTIEWTFENYIPLTVAGGSIGVQTGTNSALTFTLNGFLRSVS